MSNLEFVQFSDFEDESKYFCPSCGEPLEETTDIEKLYCVVCQNTLPLSGATDKKVSKDGAIINYMLES